MKYALKMFNCYGLSEGHMFEYKLADGHLLKMFYV